MHMLWRVMSGKMQVFMSPHSDMHLCNVDAMEHYVFCVPRCALHATQVSRMGPDAGKMDAPWR